MIHLVNFPAVIGENEKAYVLHLEGLIESVDTYAEAQIVKRLAGISVRIAPSSPETLLYLLSEIKRFHTLLGIQVEFSKSMKAGSNIFFNINI